MVLMPAFLETLARVDGRRVETLAVIARTLRETGHLPQSKTGLGASPVTAKQAASLLIACMADVGPAASPRALELYGSLKRKKARGLGPGFPVLEVVAKQETFLDALEALLALGPRLKEQAIKVLSLALGGLAPEHLLGLELFSIEVTISRPVPRATIALRAVSADGLYSDEHVCEWGLDPDLLLAGFYDRREWAARADKRLMSTITHRAIFKLSDLIAEDIPVDESLTEYDDEEDSRNEGGALCEDSRDARPRRKGRGRTTRPYGERVTALRVVEGGNPAA